MIPASAAEWASAIHFALLQNKFSPRAANFLTSVRNQCVEKDWITDSQIKWVKKRIREVAPHFFRDWNPQNDAVEYKPKEEDVVAIDPIKGMLK